MKSSGGGSTPAWDSMWWVWPRWWIWCWKRLVRQRLSGRLKYSPVSTVSKERVPSSSAGSRASQNSTYPLVLRRVGVAEHVEFLVEDLVEAGEGGGLALQALAVDEVGEEDVVQGAVDGAEEPAPVPDALLVGEPRARGVEAPVGPLVVAGRGGKFDQHGPSSAREKSPHRTTSYSEPTGRAPSTYIGANISVISRIASLSTKPPVARLVLPDRERDAPGAARLGEEHRAPGPRLPREDREGPFLEERRRFFADLRPALPSRHSNQHSTSVSNSRGTGLYGRIPAGCNAEKRGQSEISRSGGAGTYRSEDREISL